MSFFWADCTSLQWNDLWEWFRCRLLEKISDVTHMIREDLFHLAGTKGESFKTVVTEKSLLVLPPACQQPHNPTLSEQCHSLRLLHQIHKAASQQHLHYVRELVAHYKFQLTAWMCNIVMQMKHTHTLFLDSMHQVLLQWQIFDDGGKETHCSPSDSHALAACHKCQTFPFCHIVYLPKCTWWIK
jgi:hypothetical protein